jgi:threonine dehydrogenase-like Zn-dependent dehydrogenase
MEVVDLPDAGRAGSGELIVRPEAVGLCGSDFHYFHGNIGGADPSLLYPRVQGHEFSAIVEEVGSDCPSAFAAGQRVAVWPVLSCGHCYPCRIGRSNACENISLIGIHADGALQEQLRIPATQAFRVENGDARLTAFVEPMSIAVRAVERGRVVTGERVLILGAGPIGQSIAIVAIDRGAIVLLVDRVASRLTRCSCGADTALVGPGDDLVSIAREWAGGELPEVVFEATGADEPTRAALDAVAAAGRVVIVGLSNHEMPLRIGALPFRELDLLGTSTCQAIDFAAAAELVSRYRDAVTPLLTHDFSLEQAPEAIVYAIEHPDEVVKAVVHIG